MSSGGGKTRNSRAASLPRSHPLGDEHGSFKSRQAFHRPHASHHFSIHKHPGREAREGAQQLGTEIVNFLNPGRSAISSTAPSRAMSRHPSKDERDTPKTPESPRADDLRTQRSKKQATHHYESHETKEAARLYEKQLEKEYLDLSHEALAKSRQVDLKMFRIQDDMRILTNRVNKLRELMRTASGTLELLTSNTLPDFTNQHETRISNIEKHYEIVKNERIGSLDKRLDESHQRVAFMQERIEKVRREVGGWEIKDAIELRRSRKRHAALWLVVIMALILVFLFLRPWIISSLNVRDIPFKDGKAQYLDTGDGAPSEEFLANRLKTLQRPGELESILPIFDEL